MKKKRYISIRLLGSVAAVFLIVVTVLTMAFVTERKSTQTLTEEIEARIQIMARSLALMSADLLLEDYPELLLLPFINDLQNERPELAFVAVVDDRGLIRGHVDIEKVGQQLNLPANLTVTPGSFREGFEEQLLQSPELIIAVAPVEIAGREQPGKTVVALHRSYLNERIAAARRSQLLTIAVLLVFGVIAALTTVTVLLRPIKPLRKALERIGQGDLNTSVDIHDRTELGMLADTVNEMTLELKQAQDEMVEKERLNHEMELAQGIQESLRPPQQTVKGEFVIHGAQRAAAEVGGDFIDVLELPGHKIGFAVADVSGKGLGGCLSTAMVAALLRAFRSFDLSPAEMLRSLDANLQESVPFGTFVTMFYGVLEPQSGTVHFGSAGHNPVLIYRGQSRTVEWLHPKGRPLAAVRKKSRRIKIEPVEIVLNSNDLLLQYTDGITEAWHNGEHQKLFGFERIEQVVLKHAHQGAAEVAKRLFEAVDRWTGDRPRSDDEAILIVSHELQAKIAATAPESSAAEAYEPEATPVTSQQSTVVQKPSLTPAQTEQLFAMLEQARATGTQLSMTSRLKALGAIPSWLMTQPRIAHMPLEIRGLAHTAVHEICANLVEHGKSAESPGSIDVYCLTPLEGQGTAMTSGGEIFEQIGTSLFAICDRGSLFNPSIEHSVVQVDDVLNRGGRGLGLHIVARVMTDVTYIPESPYGNITLLLFDPRKCSSLLEVDHG